MNNDLFFFSLELEQGAKITCLTYGSWTLTTAIRIPVEDQNRAKE